MVRSMDHAQIPVTLHTSLEVSPHASPQYSNLLTILKHNWSINAASDQNLIPQSWNSIEGSYFILSYSRSPLLFGYCIFRAQGHVLELYHGKPNSLVLDVSNLSSLFVIMRILDDQIIKTPHRFLRARIIILIAITRRKVILLNHSFLPSSTTSKWVNGNRR
jgi:hypothetical protein